MPAAEPINPVAGADREALHTESPSDHAPYDYAYVRVVPYEHCGEYVNAGVILFCRPRRFLQARIKLDVARVQTLAPDLDLDLLYANLELVPRICGGEGPIGALEPAERFRWLVAPHNTVIQASPVHCGVCAEPASALEHLLAHVAGEELFGAPAA